MAGQGRKCHHGPRRPECFEHGNAGSVGDHDVGRRHQLGHRRHVAVHGQPAAVTGGQDAQVGFKVGVLATNGDDVDRRLQLHQGLGPGSDVPQAPRATCHQDDEIVRAASRASLGPAPG